MTYLPEDHTGPDHASAVVPIDGLPPLPQRRRQTGLLPQTADEAVAPPELKDRPAELARDTMAAFQRGTRRARAAE